MTGDKKKKRCWERKSKEDQTSHWLGEGISGQESLFLDLDPYLYLIDRAICKHALRINHSYDRHLGRPRAVIVPADGCCSWQIGYLARFFDLYIWASTNDEVLDKAASRFNARIFSGDIPLDLELVEFFLFLDNTWADELEFRRGVQEACQYLSEDGIAAFVLRCWGSEDDLEISWNRGCGSMMSDFLNRKTILGFSEPNSVSSHCLTEIAREENYGISAFLNRHREFFGKNARDFCMASINDADFRNCFSDENAKKRYVSLMIY